ncbi:MAG TPA: peptidylprolyl isomerase [Acetobacteraceae bacterium]|nr:peptidylprolyl isomerase [Acetobacteraceae bacterium]
MPAQQGAVRILAVVNGSVITNQDVDARARLFVASSGLPLQPDIVDRLRPQILRQLIDERLRMQAVEAQHIVVQDKQIAAAIREIEQRNGLPAGALRARLVAGGVDFTTLIDQVRTEIGWTLLLRQNLGEQVKVSAAETAERMAALKQEVGKPEYHVAEIFIVLDNPAHAAEANRFADVVIKQLRAGAPFPVIAAQFSESQTALQGGDRGWVQPSELDPAVAKIVEEMPPGAISEPISVPGGIVIVHLIAKREIGHDMATMLSMRQVFLPFTEPLKPNAPTPQQIATLQRAQRIAAKVNGCDEMERIAADEHSARPADPGPVRLDQVNPPPLRAMLAALPIGKPSRPLVTSDGIAVMAVCSREEKNLDAVDKTQVEQQILEKRVELMSRQLQDDLRRKATIDIRQAAGGLAAQT